LPPTTIAAALVCLAFALALSWWQQARPVPLVDGTASRLPCISYAPSRQGGDSRSGVTTAQLREDFALLSGRTDCVRTYTVSDGFDQVPAVARELGLEVLLGLWIGRDEAHNEREIDVATRIANEHRATIRAIVVGNEVLLRHERTAEELSILIGRVAAATGLPVTYADVWGHWLKNKSLARSVSFVTVHILPYWDDYPIHSDDVMPYVEELYSNLQREFPDKKLFIGETGWPSAGRPRFAIEAGRVNQARYIREFTVLAQRRGIDFNVIEAFDQKWKIAHEGTVGGHWGIYDGQRREKFAWTGAVVESPRGRTVALGALLAGVLGMLVGSFFGPYRIRVGLASCATGALLVGIGARQWEYLVGGNVNWIDWSATLAVCAACWVAFVIAVRAIVSAPAGDPIPRPLSLMVMLCCAYVCLGLVFAGRHRDFPVWIFLPGVLAFVVTAACDSQARVDALRTRSANEEVLLASWLVVAGILIPLLERFQNVRAIGWGLSSLLLGLAILAPLALQSRKGHGAA
jgi:exo-beta-1,3-glucanase (GH17 family)